VILKATSARPISNFGNVFSAGKGSEEIKDFLIDQKIWDVASQSERAYFGSPQLTDQDKVNVSWTSECVKIMSWAIGMAQLSDSLVVSGGLFDGLRSLPGYLKDTESFLQGASLRPTIELIDMADFIYAVHWAIRNKTLNGQNIPAEIDPELVQERHRAINWILFGEPWDELTTDT
jgi:Domain of unknown function (DUF4272)